MEGAIISERKVQKRSAIIAIAISKALLLLLFCSSANASYSGSYGLYNYQSTGYELSQANREVRSIASITKLFTANTILQSGVDLDEKIKINGRSSGKVPPGAYMTRMDLMRAMIISSDNRAAETLANHHPGGFAKFLADGNKYLEDHA